MNTSRRVISARSTNRKNRLQALQAAIGGAVPLGVAALVGGGAALSAGAQTYFQGNGQGAPVGGSGIWNQSLARFTNDPTGNSSYFTEGFGQFDDLIFGPAGGVVQIDNSVPSVGAESLTFQANYVITNPGLVSNASLQLGVGGNSTNAGVINTGTNTVRILPAISGTVGLVKNGTGTLILNGFSTFTGSVVVNAGTLALVDNQGGLPAQNEDIFINTGATLDYGYKNNSVVQESGIPGIGTINGGGTFHMGAYPLSLGSAYGSRILLNGTNDSTFNGVISGTGEIVKIGGSVWNLGGTNTMNGILDIGGPSNIASTLNILSDTALSPNATLTLAAQTVAATNGGSVFTININNHNVVVGNLVGNTSVSGTNSVIVLGTAGGGTTGTGGSITFGGLSYNGIGVNDIFENNITGVGNLIKTGTGAAYFINSTNNFTGRVFIQQGELSVSSDTKLGAVPTVATPAQITLDGGSLGLGNAAATINANRGILITANGGGIWTPSSFTMTYGGVMDGPGTLTKWGAAGLTLSASQTFSGGTRLLDGTITNSLAPVSGTNINVLGTGSVYVTGGTLSLSPASNKGNVILAVAPGAGSQFTYAPGAILSVSQNVNTNVTVTFGNAGDAASPFVRATNGSLTVNSGTGGLSTLGTTNGVRIFAANGNMPVTNGIVDPSIIGTATSADSTGEYLTYGAGGLALGAYSAGTDINAATSTDVFNAAANQAIASSASVYALNVRSGVTVSGGGLNVGDGAHAASVILNGGTISTTSLNFKGDAVVYASTNNGTISAPMTGNTGFTKIGAGTLTLSGSSSYSGSTYISAGTLALTVNNALPSSTPLTMQSNAVLDMSNTSQTIGTLTGSNTTSTIKLGASGSLTVGSGSSQYYGLITGTTASSNGGSATLIKNGPGTLTLGWIGSGPDNFGNVANTYNKLAVQNGGIVSVSSSGELGATIGGTVAASFAGSSVIPDAITLNGGQLQLTSGGTDAFISNLASSNNYGANRGIALGAGGGTISVSQFFEVASFGTTVGTDFAIVGTNTAATATTSGSQSAISGPGALTIDGKGTFRTFGSNTYTGGTILKGGIFQTSQVTNSAVTSLDSAFGAIPSSFQANNIIFDGGELENSVTYSLSTNRGIFVTANGGTIWNSGANFLEIDGPITGPGILTSIGQTSPGLILTNSNNNFGGLNVNNNWVIIGNSNVFGTGVVTINPQSTYVFIRMDASGTFTENNSWVLAGDSIDSFRVGNQNGTASNLVLNGVISGTADLIKDSGNGVTLNNGAGLGTFVLGGNNTYTGNTIVKTGMVVVAANNALGSTALGTQVFSGAAIGFQGGVNYTSPEPLSVAGVGVSGTGGAIVNINGVNRFAGPVSLMDNTTVEIADGSSLELAGAITGAPAVTVNGDTTNTTFILSGNNTFAGGLTVNNLGTLGVGSNTALGSNGGSVNLSIGTLLGVANATISRDLSIGSAIVDAVPNTTLSLSGNLSYNSPLTKGTSGGTVQLAQASGFTASGDVNVNGGTLAVGFAGVATGPLVVPGTLNIADTAKVALLPSTTGVGTNSGIVHTINSLNLNNTGILDLGNTAMTVGSSTATSTVRQYLVKGYSNGNWNGTSGGGITSTWAANDATKRTAIGYVGQPDGTTLVAATLYGDTTLKGSVGLSDYNTLASNFNKPGVWAQGDFNYDGTVGLTDYNLLAANFNKHAQPGGGAAAAGAGGAAKAASVTLTSGSASPAGQSVKPVGVVDPGAGNVALEADPTSGKLYLVGHDSNINSYEVDSAAGKLTFVSQKNTGGYSTLSAQSTAGFIPGSNNPNEDIWAIISSQSGTFVAEAYPASDNPAYDIVGPGLQVFDLNKSGLAAWTAGTPISDLTFKYGNGTGATLTPAVINLAPEPTCLALAGIAAGGLLSRRRRKAR